MGERQERIRYDLMAPRAPEDGPIDLRASIPGEGPLEIDIGFGRGHSVFDRARFSPTSRILGIEIKSKLAYKVDERRKREGLERVRILCGDVRLLLPRLGPDGSVARVFVYFPDPWWKKRHQHRRVLGNVLLDEVGRLLAPGGELFVQTDVEERAAEYLDAIGAHEAFVLSGSDGRIDHNPLQGRSNREVRAEEDGLPIHRILAFRRGLAATQATDARCGRT